MINICVPVLKRYDLLEKLLLSLHESTIQPDTVYVINNGRDVERLKTVLLSSPCPTRTILPAVPLGLAEAWNIFIRRVPTERFIVNDDIEFAPTSVERMLDEKACFVSCTFGFSCFLLRDECVERVGFFDESISPGYAYFEDRDYLNRMREAGVVDSVVDCGVKHAQSQTPAAYTDEETIAHHKKFVIAQENFLRKWKTLPSDLERQFA